MNLSANSVTSSTLLIRLQRSPSDHSAWAEFLRKYGPHIIGWCRKWGLQEADAHDVSQIVLVKLLRAMQTFHYDPHLKFRAWLKTVTHHAWRDLVRSRRRFAKRGEEAFDVLLESTEARDELADWVNGAYQQELLDEALVRVRPRVEQQTWDAFYLTTYEGLTGAEAAARLGLAVTSIYKAKSNIRKLLEAEIRSLEEVPM